MTQSFQKVRALTGMKDVLPDASAQWESLEAVVREWLAAYGYRNMRTPVLEHTRLFTRGIGEVTDIVRSEEHTSELQSLMRISYAVFCLKKKKKPLNFFTQQP